MSIRQGSNIISGAKSKELGLLTPQWYDYVLEDINWIRADNFSWHKGAFYTATYQHLLNDINGKTPQSETIEGTTITYYLADDGHKIVERNQESAVQTIYENTGASWYYIIDRNNSLFKLPRARAQAENMHLYFYAGNFAQSLDENNPTVPITGETNWGEIGGVLSDQTDLQDVLDSKAFLTDIGNATLTIQKNATTIDTFTANSKTDKTINIVVPTTPQEVNALPDTTKYAANASLTIDSSTYVVTLQLKDQDGSNIGTAQTIDLPLESVVVSGRYDSANKKIILTLQDGSTIDIPVADLIAGLQSEITVTNKLDADLVDDTTAAHKFVTASDKTTWNAKQDAISDLSTIRSNATAGKGAADTIATYGDIVTHDVSEFATSTQGGKADTAIQPGDNISELTNDAAYVQTLADLGITATAEELNALDGVTASVSELNILDGATVTTAELNVLDGITASTTELNYTDGVTSNIQTQLDDKVAKNAAITGATKTKITYDSKGLVTAGDDLAENDIPSLHMSKISDVTATATELNYVGGVTSAIQTQIDGKVDKTSSASKVYGTDANGDQTTYNYNSFGKVDDVKVGTTSVVTNKIANLGTMAGETATNYYTKVSADGTFIKVNPTITGATKTKITYDAKGLVTAGDDLAESDIPSIHLSKVSDVTATAAEVNVLDGITATTAELNYVDGVTSNIQTQLDSKQATISDLATIRSGAAAGATALQPNDNISELVNDTGYITGITSSDVTTALGYTPYNSTNPSGYQANVIESISVNNTAQTITNKNVDITVPTTAAEVNALPDTTKYGSSLTLSINSSTYVVTAQLKDQDGNNLGTAQTIDLPLESVVVSGRYDSTTKEVILTLQDGSEIKFSVADLISGLQSEITSTNKLDADLVDDSTSAHKFVTASDKTTWSGKQDALVSGTNIKTINNNSLLGSGDITIDSLPTQTGQSGKFLTTDGTDASWATVDALPSQSGQSGKFLTTDGTDASWGDALVNTATAQNALTILGTPNTTSNNSRSINVGYNSSVSKWDAIALGAGSIAKESNSLSIGDGSEAWNMPSIAIGSHAVAKGTFSIQLGGSPYGSMFSTNDEANTLKVCLGANTQNYKLLDGNGTIPEARLADTTSATSGQVLQLDSNLNAVWATPQAGSSTLSNLTDVTITSASSGQVLSYNGTNWENSEPTPAMVIVDYTAA